MPVKPHVSDQEARRMLDKAIERAGSQSAYAERLGVSRQFISSMVAGSRPLSGSVLEDLCLEAVNSYRFLGPQRSPEQERYENGRAEWRTDHPIITNDVLTKAERAEIEANERNRTIRELMEQGGMAAVEEWQAQQAALVEEAKAAIYSDLSSVDIADK